MASEYLSIWKFVTITPGSKLSGGQKDNTQFFLIYVHLLAFRDHNNVSFILTVCLLPVLRKAMCVYKLNLPYFSDRSEEPKLKTFLLFLITNREVLITERQRRMSINGPQKQTHFRCFCW